MPQEPQDMNAPSPWRYCRQQLLAFLVLNLLGSCVHSAAVQDRQPLISQTQAIAPVTTAKAG